MVARLGGRRSVVVFLDTISALQTSEALTDDRVPRMAKRLLDSLADTWVATAHAPRADSSHVYGSVHFEAMADSVIQAAPHEGDCQARVELSIVKRNTGPKVASAIVLEFEPDGDALTAIHVDEATPRPAASAATPKGPSGSDRLLAALQEKGVPMTTAQLSEALGASLSSVGNYVSDLKGRIATTKQGKESLYSLPEWSQQ